MNQQQAREAIVAAAREWEGTFYEFGGDGRPEHGIDCSALVQRAYQTGVGIALPRVSHDQFDVCWLIREDAARPGDLIFYRWTYPAPGTNGWTHVGIVTGPNTMIDAPGHPQVVGERAWYTNYPRQVARPHLLAMLPDDDQPSVPQLVGEGTVARIEADELRLRAVPSTSAPSIDIIPNRSRVVVTRDDAPEADGYRWVRVATRVGNGWVAVSEEWFKVEGRYEG